MEKMKKCKACGKDIAKSAKICPGCGKSQKTVLGSLARIILGLFLIFVGIGVVVILNDEDSSFNSSDSDKCYITLAEFNEIKTGMSYEEVKNIVGCEGTVVSDTEVMGTKMTIYSWYGKDGISNANVNINNGELVNKTQVGLK